jgi:hypothetical protein
MIVVSGSSLMCVLFFGALKHILNCVFITYLCLSIFQPYWSLQEAVERYAIHLKKEQDDFL